MLTFFADRYQHLGALDHLTCLAFCSSAVECVPVGNIDHLSFSMLSGEELGGDRFRVTGEFGMPLLVSDVCPVHRPWEPPRAPPANDGDSDDDWRGGYDRANRKRARATDRKKARAAPKAAPPPAVVIHEIRDEVMHAICLEDPKEVAVDLPEESDASGRSEESDGDDVPVEDAAEPLEDEVADLEALSFADGRKRAPRLLPYHRHTTDVLLNKLNLRMTDGWNLLFAETPMNAPVGRITCVL